MMYHNSYPVTKGSHLSNRQMLPSGHAGMNSGAIRPSATCPSDTVTYQWVFCPQDRWREAQYSERL